MRLLAIDPGKDACGWAMFVDDVLVNCGRDARHWTAYGKLLVVAEVPQIYDVRRWKGDPNDCIAIAVALGLFVGSLEAGNYVELVQVSPADHKGQRPKSVVHARIDKVLGALEARTLAHWTGTKKHRLDVLDAVGIGLWKLGRLWA